MTEKHLHAHRHVDGVLHSHEHDHADHDHADHEHVEGTASDAAPMHRHDDGTVHAHDHSTGAHEH